MNCFAYSVFVLKRLNFSLICFSRSSFSVCSFDFSSLIVGLVLITWSKLYYGFLAPSIWKFTNYNYFQSLFFLRLCFFFFRFSWEPTRSFRIKLLSSDIADLLPGLIIDSSFCKLSISGRDLFNNSLGELLLLFFFICIRLVNFLNKIFVIVFIWSESHQFFFVLLVLIRL